MLKTQNNKELVEIAHTIHKELKMRCEHNCFSCDRDCMVMDMAKYTRAFGYTKSEKSVRRSMMEKSTTLRDFAEELGKKLAASRGYGCNSSDYCRTCTCDQMVGCLPLEVATGLIRAGYRKTVKPDERV